jgi:hypothetical protein
VAPDLKAGSSLRRVIAICTKYASLVFYLNKDDGVGVAIQLLEVAHEGCEGSTVGPAIRVGQRAQGFDCLVR